MIKNQDFGADEIYEWRLKGWYWRGRWKKENLISDASPRYLPAATAAKTLQQESNHWKVTLLPFSDIVTFLVTFYWHQAPSLVVCLNIFFLDFSHHDRRQVCGTRQRGSRQPSPGLNRSENEHWFVSSENIIGSLTISVVIVIEDLDKRQNCWITDPSGMIWSPSGQPSNMKNPSCTRLITTKNKKIVWLILKKNKRKHILMQERWSPSSNSISENESDERRGRLCRDQVSTFFECPLRKVFLISLGFTLDLIYR